MPHAYIDPANRPDKQFPFLATAPPIFVTHPAVHRFRSCHSNGGQYRAPRPEGQQIHIGLAGEDGECLAPLCADVSCPIKDKRIVVQIALELRPQYRWRDGCVAKPNKRRDFRRDQPRNGD